MKVYIKPQASLMMLSHENIATSAKDPIEAAWNTLREGGVTIYSEQYFDLMRTIFGVEDLDSPDFDFNSAANEMNQVITGGQ